MTNRFYIFSIFALAAVLSLFLLKTDMLTNTLHAHSKIPVITNLQQESRQNHKPLPILLMFSIQNCPYCAIVQEEFLEPMKISGDYESKLVMRIIDMNEPSLIDFNGQQIRTNNLAMRYKVTLAPTIILVDNTGKLLSEPLVGITTRDYYGGYLDQAIDEALKKIKEK